MGLFKTTAATPKFVPQTIADVDQRTGELKRMTLTIKAIEMAFDKVDQDPRAGLGNLTKKEEFLNEVAKLLNSCDLPEPKAGSGPLLSEPKTPAPRASRSASAQAAPGVPVTRTSVVTAVPAQPDLDIPAFKP